jgi:hypothetical protein
MNYKKEEGRENKHVEVKEEIISSPYLMLWV